MALHAARVGVAWVTLSLTAIGGVAVAQSRSAPPPPPPPPPLSEDFADSAAADLDPAMGSVAAATVPRLRRDDGRSGIRRQTRAEAPSPPPAPIRRADDTVVVCSILLQGTASTVTGGAAVEPGIARISGDGTAIEVVWSGVRIEGEEGQRRASCRAEDQQVVSVVLDGEELLDGPQPY